MLRNSAGGDLAVTPNGTGADRFDFPTVLATGAPFAVTVKTQPGAPAQSCTVANGAGTVASASVTNVAITCAALRTVSARVVGLDAGRSVVLQNNGKDDLAFAGEGTQTFATTIASGGAYAVTVLSQPSGGSCVVSEGSGTVGAADVVVEVSCPRNVFVDAVAGLDTNVGSAAAPWKTITHAIAAMPVAGGTIQLAPGIYSEDSGERFPLKPRSNQTIVGDVATKGASATPTVVRGAGGYTPAAGDLGKFPTPFTYSVVFAPGVTGTAVKGVAFATTDSYAFLADGATVSLDSDYAMEGAGFAGNGAQLTITNSTLGGPAIALVVVDSTTSLKLRGTTLSGGEDAAGSLVVGVSSIVPAGNIDLGSIADPGNNSFPGSAGSVGVALLFCSGTLSAVGNTWVPNKQGADASGRYASALVPGPVVDVDGNNYSLVTGTSILF